MIKKITFLGFTFEKEVREIAQHKCAIIRVTNPEMPEAFWYDWEDAIEEMDTCVRRDYINGTKGKLIIGENKARFIALGISFLVLCDDDDEDDDEDDEVIDEESREELFNICRMLLDYLACSVNLKVFMFDM